MQPVIVVQAPVEPWLQQRYRCKSCGAVVQFENKDRGDSAFKMRNERPTRGRCAHCLKADAQFELVQEADSAVR
jgi:transposase-like protein